MHPLGIPVDPRSFWSYMVSISVAGQVLFLPVVGAIADYGQRKKEVLAATAYLGASRHHRDVFPQGQRLSCSEASLFLIANVSFGASW